MSALLPEDAQAAEYATKCADLGHPGSCYNPALDTTWCACGTVTRPGNNAQHITCCDGPLNPDRNAFIEWRTRQENRT